MVGSATMNAAMHDDELMIDEDLIRSLLRRDVAAYAELPLRPLDSTGSTNRLFRLGEEHLVRLPRQPGGSATITQEARRLPGFAANLSVAVPEVAAVGEPGFGYPERWSVVRWLDGEKPGPGAGDVTAADLAGVVTGLRRTEVPQEALEDPELRWYRGEPIAGFDADVRFRLKECRELAELDLDLDAVESVWDQVMALPPAAAEPRWVHGDLLAENLLSRDGRLTAVLDFGALSVGDPTVDLICAWELLDVDGRDEFRALLDLDDATWLRSRAWALFIAVMTFPYYWKTMPVRCADRLVMARAALGG
ncbi:aminoglycoside phosphotransferase family protein [Nocardioides sp. NPDC057577]|uniref:aminoglycoside phosphotransferase family protein n=1 Tax=Nocardioides sp. NPDC057577 TaxID=3346171 RepID=UPI00366F9ADA